MIAAALVANAVVIGLAAIAAIAVLLVALLGCSLTARVSRKDRAGREPFEPVRGEVEGRCLPEQLCRDGVADCGRLHEAMAEKPQAA